jgi:hypothetical protein
MKGRYSKGKEEKEGKEQKGVNQSKKTNSVATGLNYHFVTHIASIDPHYSPRA